LEAEKKKPPALPDPNDKVLPFAAVPYPQISTPDAKFQTALQNAYDAQKAAGKFGPNSHIAISMIALAKDGAHVILVARTVGGLEETDDEIRKCGGSATLVPLDLKNFAGIDHLGATIYERWGRLDGFLGNAGVLGALTPLAHLSPQVWHESIDVNVTSNWRLIRSLDPLLRKSDAGRVVFVSSGAARSFRPYWGSYSIAKAAL